MREKGLFILFVMYSAIPLVVSLLLIISKLANWVFLQILPGDIFMGVVQVCVIIVPWMLFFMNSHIYFVKKIQGLGFSRIFLGITILQGAFSLIALSLLLSIIFF